MVATRSRSNGSSTTSGNGGKGFEPKGAYEEAVLGFREYWYPICMKGDVTETPKAFTLLGDPVVLVRRDGEIYALKDECPHRGTQLSLLNTRKNLEFPGTPTITCPYHGWTYDVRDGRCVAVISEGPDSPVPQAGVRVKTYPIEVRRGIVWIWMGSGKPVPVEEDIPNLLLDPEAVVKGFYRVKWGNWRYHAENVAAGHAGMVHKSTLRNWFPKQITTPSLPPDWRYGEDEDAKGIRPVPRVEAAAAAAPDTKPGHIVLGGGVIPQLREFPGLGVWHTKPRWQRYLLDWLPTSKRPIYRSNIRGIRTQMLFLPGVFRQPHFPNTNYMYYEWYVPVDEEHYIYMQIMAFWPKNLMDRLWHELKYYFWDRPTGPVLFNNQDAAMVAATTKYVNRTGNIRYLTKVSKNDEIDIEWRRYCDEHARGVGTAYQKKQAAEAATIPAEAQVAGGGD